MSRRGVRGKKGLGRGRRVRRLATPWPPPTHTNATPNRPQRLKQSIAGLLPALKQRRVPGASISRPTPTIEAVPSAQCPRCIRNAGHAPNRTGSTCPVFPVPAEALRTGVCSCCSRVGRRGPGKYPRLIDRPKGWGGRVTGHLQLSGVLLGQVPRRLIPASHGVAGSRATNRCPAEARLLR